MTRTRKAEGGFPTGAPASLPQAAGPAGSPSSDEAFSKVLRLVRAVHTGMRNIDRSHRLSGSQLWALWQISAQPGQRVSELADALQIHPSTASNLLDKLEARGFVRRERRDLDNRVVRLYLTKAGVGLVRQVPGPMQGVLRNALQQTSAPMLAALCQGVTSVLDLMDRPPRPFGLGADGKARARHSSHQ